MTPWRVVVVAFVAILLVLSPPLAAASDQCMAMGAMCEGPCGASAWVPKLSLSDGTLPLTAAAPGHPHHIWDSIDPSVLELPPRASLPLV